MDMKEQEVQPDAQAGVQFMGSKASPPASSFSQETWIAALLGSCSGGSEPRQCTEPHAPKWLSAWLGVQLCLAPLARRCQEGGWVSGAVRMALGSEERRALCFCLLRAAQGCERPASLGPWTGQPACFPIMSMLICPAPGASGVCTKRVSSRLFLPVHAHLNHLCVLV